MLQVSGTRGYKAVLDRFILATEAIDFEVLHHSIIKFIPTKPSQVLDVGAGIGRDAHVLAQMGHQVTAVEPIVEFLTTAKLHHNAAQITWVNDSLPLLTQLDRNCEQFHFILASAVWHHLDPKERAQAMERISTLLRPGGFFAISLRHGPPGAGTHVFSVNGQQELASARSCGLGTLLHLKNQPSLMSNKEDVTWTKLVFRKPNMIGADNRSQSSD